MISFKTSSGGGTVNNPTAGFIWHSLFEDLAAWSSAPDVLLTYSDGGHVSKLLVAYAESIGYYVQYIDGSLWILSCGDMTEIDKEVIEIDQDYEVSKGLLCDKDTTWLAVAWFNNNGEKCPTLHWVSDHKLPAGVVF